MGSAVRSSTAVTATVAGAVTVAAAAAIFYAPRMLPTLVRENFREHLAIFAATADVDMSPRRCRRWVMHAFARTYVHAYARTYVRM